MERRMGKIVHSWWYETEFHKAPSQGVNMACHCLFGQTLEPTIHLSVSAMISMAWVEVIMTSSKVILAQVLVGT